jgi:hypothetical protein
MAGCWVLGGISTGGGVRTQCCKFSDVSFGLEVE